jgi:putative transcriptional regulator
MLQIRPFLLIVLVLLGTLSSFRVSSEEQDGVFLVARRGLENPTFKQTVVLVARHSEGPVGVILNRPTRRRLSNMLSQIEQLQGNPATVSFGGPIAYKTLVFTFRSGTPPRNSLLALEDLYLSKDRALLEEILQGTQSPTDLRVYTGYLTWAPDQLEAQIGRGDWLILNENVATVFSHDASTMWPALVKRAYTRSARDGIGYFLAYSTGTSDSLRSRAQTGGHHDRSP